MTTTNDNDNNTTTTTTTTTTSCPCADLIDSDGNCKQCQRSLANSTAEIERLKRELEEKDAAMERMQQDMHTLNQKYVAEINRVAEVQHEKDMVEHELEELSCRLFEQANGMVAAEKREKWLLEQQLQQAEEHLRAEKSQLQELRERMMKDEQHEDAQVIVRARKDLQQLHIKRASATNLYRRKTTTNTVAQKKQQQQQSRITSMPPPPPSAPVTQKTMTIDEIQLEAFQEFVQSSRSKKLNQFAYMKHCLAEDVEPCLRFGPHSRLSVKKLNEYLSRQPCFIEQHQQDSVPTGTTYSSAAARPLWERFSSNHHHHHQQQPVCVACGRSSEHSPLNYRFRVDEMDEWAPIDQYCRDRLVAVCEFYVFIRNIQHGLYSDRAIDDLYAENICLRLQMFYSR